MTTSDQSPEATEPEGDLRVEPTPPPVIGGILEAFPSAAYAESHGQATVVVDREDYHALAAAARDAGFDVCADLTCVDWFGRRRVRFELVVNLLSHPHRLRLRILVPVPGDDPVVASVCDLWPGANFPEREVFDMFGLVFDGHPDLTRILMPDDWEGHPLRKDFAVGSVPVQFKESHKAT